MRPMRFSGMVFVAALMGCGNVHGLVPTADDTLARAFIDSLRANPSVSPIPLLSPSWASAPDVRESLVRVASRLPVGPIDTLAVVGVTVTKSVPHDLTRRFIDYRMHTGGGFAAVQVVVLTNGLMRSIEGVTVRTAPDSVVAKGRFAWATATWGGMMALGGAICLAVLCLVAAFAIVRTSMPRRWLWALVCLIGVGTYAVPWSGGPAAWQSGGAHFLVLSAGVQRLWVYGPMYILLAFPLGALVALGRREEFLRGTGLPMRGIGASIVWTPLSVLGRLVVPRTIAKAIPLDARIWVSVFQIGGGLAAFGLGFYNSARGERAWDAADTALIVLSTVSIIAGVLLWRGMQAGLALSRFLLALQVVRVYAAQFMFGLAIVPQLFTIVWTSESHDIAWGLGEMEWRFGADPSAKLGVEIHLAALVLLVLLLVRWPPRAPATLPTDAIEGAPVSAPSA